MKILIDGMMCNHCAGRVKEVLSALDGVKGVEIDLKKKLAIIDGEVDINIVKEEVEKAGYKFIGVK
jgi:copper chaperone CopZ